MAIERKWERQDTLLFTADGGEDGTVTLNDVENFKVKQKIVLSSNTQLDLRLEVKKVISTTILLVGPIKDKQNPKGNLLSRTNISAYTVADGAGIRAQEQDKVRLKPDDVWAAIYEQEPTVALRMFSVDYLGRSYNVDNPIPVKPDTLTPGVDYDEIDITYPTTTQELFTYTLSAVSVRTVTIDYTDACKEDILKVTYNEL
jgi:hypothetical protein